MSFANSVPDINAAVLAIGALLWGSKRIAQAHGTQVDEAFVAAAPRWFSTRSASHGHSSA